MMTIRRQWMIVLVISVIISVAVNSFVLSSLINRYFVDYTTSNYNEHFSQILAFSQKSLEQQNYSQQQLAVQLETHLNDPITRIKLYDNNGKLLADVSNDRNGKNAMMKNKTMNRFMGPPAEEVDSAEISSNGVTLGKLNITRYSSLGNSVATRMFKIALIGNSILSFGAILIFVVILGNVVSKKMSKDLMSTASLALNVDLGNAVNPSPSNVREIRTIQQSLETLQSRLKLKQTSRKTLVDELVHQTRTPLTILKTHLEGFQDGVIHMTTEEIKTCEAQIEDITLIISNMSSMLDAQKDSEIIKLEEVELNQLLKQIIGGLRIQFHNKQIDLRLTSYEKLVLVTDKYKLSQCFYNILTNAYKFTNANGKVLISYKTIGNEVFINIEDSGIGINNEDKNHLFEAYFRGSNSNAIKGEGIGLYLVKENLNIIKGTINVESEIGKGSKFTIKIPLVIN